jgi:outer membrane receptor for ferric coprogen and ferric-rhodotorulic acid
MAIGLCWAAPVMAAETATDEDERSITVTGQQMDGPDTYTAQHQNAAIGLDLSPRETPQTITVLTRQLLDDQRIETIDDVLGKTPGVSSYAQDNAGRITYRSRGFDITNYKIDGMQVDGQTNFSGVGTSMNMDLYDNLQIIRGANGLLGGTGDPSATIYLQRKAPGTKLAAQGMLTLGNWNKRRAMGDLNLPITRDGHVRSRLVFTDESTDTFRDREHVARRGVLGNVAVDLGPRTVLNGGLQYERTRNDGASWGGNVPIWFADGSLANLPRSTNPVTNWSVARRNPPPPSPRWTINGARTGICACPMPIRRVPATATSAWPRSTMPRAMWAALPVSGTRMARGPSSTASIPNMKPSARISTSACRDRSICSGAITS